METKNAKITGTMLGIEDHGIFTCFICLEYGGSGQGFGGHALDEYDKEADTRIGVSGGIEYIRKVLEVIEVDSWEELKGKYCRVIVDNFKVYSIGNITKEKWFDPQKDINWKD